MLLSLSAIWATASRVLTLIYIALRRTPRNRDMVKQYGVDGCAHNAVTVVQEPKGLPENSEYGDYTGNRVFIIIID